MIEELKKELNDLCSKTNTRSSGINYLINYYQTSLKWSEEESIKYVISLFKNGTIEKIKVLGKDGKEL